MSILLLTLISSQLCAQQITVQEWDLQAETNKSMLPKYGNLPKDETELQADSLFFVTIAEKDNSRISASKELIKLGFTNLYRNEVKIAMYRFNQAYLLDSLNSDIYWGFAAVYMTIGAADRAKLKYEEGLKMNPQNTHLLTDYGTYYMSLYFESKNMDSKKAGEYLNAALKNLNASYKLDALDENTTFKLSVCYWSKNECDKAWRFHDECKTLGGRPISEEYTNELLKSCKRKVK